MKLDPPTIPMLNPEAFLAGVRFARGFDALESIFGEAEPYQLLLERTRGLMAAIEAWSIELDRVLENAAADPDLAPLRAVCARICEADAAMWAAAPAFFELLWRSAILEALSDPSGQTARGVLGQLLKIEGVSPEHVEALWKIVTRSARWEEMLASEPGIAFPHWLHASIVRLGRELATADRAPARPIASAPEPASLADLDRLLVS